MPFITELHCHTGEVSNCASSTSEFIVKKYIDAGYTSLTVMNHLSCHTFGKGDKHKYHGSDSWEDKIEFFMNGVRLVEKIAGERLNVLWGIELRLNKDDNDYLIYGIDENFLLSNPDILDIPVKELSPRVHAVGSLLYQAHPFRNTMKITKPSLLDGIETYNGHPEHDSRNDIAALWADKYGLRRVSGTDFHKDSHMPTGGIVTDIPITSNSQLLEILKNGCYTPLHSGEQPVS